MGRILRRKVLVASGNVVDGLKGWVVKRQGKSAEQGNSLKADLEDALISVTSTWLRFPFWPGLITC